MELEKDLAVKSRSRDQWKIFLVNKFCKYEGDVIIFPKLRCLWYRNATVDVLKVNNLRPFERELLKTRELTVTTK